MTEYDNTNSGIVGTPYDDQKFVASGKVDIEGNTEYLVAIRQPLKKGGDPVIVLYKTFAVLYPNTPKEGQTLSEKAPQYSGPIDGMAGKRIAAWKGSKDGRHYLSLKVSDKQSDAQVSNKPQSAQNDDWNGGDEIPF